MVERFYCVGPEGIEMRLDPIGGYVRWGDYDALAARLAEAIAWIEYAHRSDCRTVPDHNGDAYWSCDCGRDELVKNLRAAVSEEPAP